MCEKRLEATAVLQATDSNGLDWRTVVEAAECSWPYRCPEGRADRPCDGFTVEKGRAKAAGRASPCPLLPLP